jgi:pimeloyl-ACP methyl ester carboxylesterase
MDLAWRARHAHVVRKRGGNDRGRDAWVSGVVSRPRLRLGLVAALLAGSCTGGIAPAATAPAAFQAIPCPSDVLPEIPQLRSCGYVTVPQDRHEPDGETVRLFVTRVEPASDDGPADPMLRLGHDLGWQPNYKGIAPLANRVDREVIILDLRGVGHSEPSLACPEVRSVQSASPGVSTGDPGSLDTFIDAVASCRDRLVGDRIDLSTYNLAEMAADVEDTRAALGIEEWNLQTGGTWSTVLFEVMRRFPEHVRTVIFDSPDVPEVDLLTEAIVGTRHAMHQVAASCSRDRGCRLAYPDVEGLLREDLLRLRRTPARVRWDGHELTIRDSTLIRLVRQWLSGGDLDEVPSLLSTNDVGRLAIVGETIASGPALTDGYTRVAEERSVTFSEGTFYSVMCHDELPFIDRRALLDLAGDEPWYADAYVDGPYVRVCSHWGVDRAPVDPHSAVRSDIPTLLLVGRFDPFAPLDLVRMTAATLSTSWVVEIPNWSHNVLQTSCALEIRNGWIDHPTSPPDTACIGDLDRMGFAA